VSEQPVNEERASGLQRVLMDRALAQAERAAEKAPRRPLQTLFALLAGILVALAIFGGFAKFFAGMQRLAGMMEQLDRAEELRKAKEPIPAFAVTPDDTAAAGAAVPSTPGTDASPPAATKGSRP
jgi:hypothetical protein